MIDHSTTASSGLLDRPLFGSKKITWWTALCVAIILFVVLTRFWALDTRAYDHDESIHAWEAWKLATGQGYTHNPIYHGPFLYHITALTFVLFGDNNLTARVATSLAGVLLSIMPLFFTKWIGRKGALMAMLLSAVSPVMMHRSRFLRHDHFALLFNVILMLAIVKYLDLRKDKYLYLAAAALSLGFAGKETSYITVFIFGVFLVGLIVSQWIQDRSRHFTNYAVFDLIVVIGTLVLPLASPVPIKLLGHDPLDYSASGILFSGAVFVAMLAVSVGIGLWWDWRRWLICASLYYGLYLVLFTTFFTNGQGAATGMVGALGYWLSQQTVARGSQPRHYYIVLLLLYEFLPLFGAIGAAVYYSLRGEPRERAELPEPGRDSVPVVAMLILWTGLSFAMYSWAGEKMPWLAMQWAIPLHLLAGWGYSKLTDLDWRELWTKGGLWLLFLIPLLLYALISVGANAPSTDTTIEAMHRTMAWLTALVVAGVLLAGVVLIARRLSRADTLRVIGLSLSMVLLGLTIRFAWMATFINADLASEFLVYAQAPPDDHLVAQELEEMSRRLTGGLHMRVAYDSDTSWPFVWYLRNYTNAQFFGTSPNGPVDAEVVLVGLRNEDAVRPLLGNRYFRRQFRFLWWPNQDWYMNMTPASLWHDLQDPEARQKLWNVVWKREYDVPLTQWPLLNEFVVFVRRDAAAQLWDYGLGTGLLDESAMADLYVDRWNRVSAVTSWGSPGELPGELNAPKGIALDQAGNLYVADNGNHRIQVFNSQGELLRSWGAYGDGPGELNEPWGVAVAESGEVYVADTWNHRVQVFDAEGRFLRMWGVFGESNAPQAFGERLYGPRDVAIDGEGSIYVADTGNKRVVKYDPNGVLLGAAGGFGQDDGKLQEPVGIALDGEGHLYVADTWNHRVQVFDSELGFIRAWDVEAWWSTSVNNKPYLALDTEGHVYVTDPEGYRVIEFSREGEVLSVWGQHGADLASTNLPTGIEVDGLGRILVSDSANDRILLFERQQSEASE